MNVKYQYEITDINGTIIEKGHGGCNLNNPIFLNMQFFMEKEEYIKLINTLKDNGTSLYNYLQDILETDPDELTF